MLAALVALLEGAARASDPLTLFGFGPRSEALGGALTADASGALAAFHNPGGVARSADAEVVLGWSYGVIALTYNGGDAAVTPPEGISAGLSVPLALGPVRLAFGLSLHVPDQLLARVTALPLARPSFVLLESGPDRVVVQPVLSLRLSPLLSLGAGVTLLADAAGDGVALDVGLAGGSKVSRAALDVALPLRAALVAGVVVEPTARLRLGLSYRGAIDLGVRIAASAHVDVAGVVQGSTTIALRTASHYTPARLSAGAAWDITPSLTAHAELGWQRWSAWDGPFADLSLAIDLGVAPPLVPYTRPTVRLRDTFVPKLAGEYRGRLSRSLVLAGRLGLGYEPTPVPASPGLFTLVDNDRVVVSTGAGLLLEDLVSFLEKPLRVDVGFGWHELLPRSEAKDAAILPGTATSSGGRILRISVGLEARF